MKLNFYFIFPLLLFSTCVLAQRDTATLNHTASSSYYRTLSKQQKNGATALLITGGAIAAVGGFIWFISPVAGLSETGDVKEAKRTGQTMAFVGTGLAAISIPLFAASKRNKEKAALYIGATGLLVPNAAKNALCIGTRIRL